MSIEAIFTEIILDHYKHPRCFGKLDDADLSMDGANPLCGDEITLHVKIGSEKVEKVSFEGKACAICMASTSMFSEIAPGKSFSDLEELKATLRKMLHGEELTRDERRAIGDMYALEGVAKLPVRVKCALLVWETWELMRKELSG